MWRCQPGQTEGIRETQSLAATGWELLSPVFTHGTLDLMGLTHRGKVGKERQEAIPDRTHAP